MTRFRFLQRAVVVLVLAALLAAPAIAGSEPRARSENRASLVARLVELRVQLWGFLNSVWEKAGCAADPHGACIEGSTTDVPSQTDAGCHIDPHGGCASGQ